MKIYTKRDFENLEKKHKKQKIIIVAVVFIIWTTTIFNTFKIVELYLDYQDTIQTIEKSGTYGADRKYEVIPITTGAVVHASHTNDWEITEIDTSSHSVEDKICEVFPENCAVMVAIAKAESGLDPNEPPNTNNNGSTDTGIFRINSIHGYSQEYLDDVDNNIKVAKIIYDTQGITAWVAYNNNKYLEFL